MYSLWGGLDRSFDTTGAHFDGFVHFLCAVGKTMSSSCHFLSWFKPTEQHFLDQLSEYNGFH